MGNTTGDKYDVSAPDYFNTSILGVVSLRGAHFATKQSFKSDCFASLE